MPVERFFVWRSIRLTLLAVEFVVAVLGTGFSSAEELDAAERKKAVQSLRDYQALFKSQAIELDARVRKHFRPAEGEGPAWYAFRIEAANGWMYTEEDIGQILQLQSAESDARYSRKAVFDSRTNRGLQVYLRDDGKMTEAARTCVATGIGRLTSWRLVQAVGWLDYWPQFYKEADRLMDAADVLESCPAIQRVTASDGRVQLVASLVLDLGIEYEVRYSDLPQVRMTAVRMTAPGRAEATGEVRYKPDPDGFQQPHAFREIRRRLDRTPPQIELIEEAVVTHFSMRLPTEPLPMPVIEVPDDVQVRDDCPDDKREDQVPTPTPETR